MRPGRRRRSCAGSTGSASATFYKWRGEVRRDGGVGRPAAEGLEDENRRLKKLLAESMLDVATLREIARKKVLTPGRGGSARDLGDRREGYSQRRACGLVGLDPKTLRYASRRPDDAAVRGAAAGAGAERRRFGYRRLHILLRREGIAMNHKKLFRLYREERLTVRRRGGRKRALGTRAPMAMPQGPNQRWIAGLRLRRARPTAGASASWPWSTTSPASAWRWSSTPRCPAMRVARELDAIVARRAAGR